MYGEKPTTMKMTLTFKYILTFSLFFCYFVYGVNFYVVGPTLIELAGLFQTTIEKICLIYTVRSAGYTLGSLSGFLFKYVNRQLMFCFFLFLMGITLAAMPHVTSLTMLFVLAGINGFSIGSFDTAINVWILEIWQEESGPFMQALHFTYGIGSFVAPLICEPFLSTEAVHTGHGPPSKSLESSSTLFPTTAVTSTPSSIYPGAFSLVNETGMIDFNHGIDPIDFLIYVPYAIAGFITVLGSVLILVLYYVNKYEPPKKPSHKEYELKTMNENGEAGDGKQMTKQKTSPTMTILLVGMGSLFLTFFVGMEQMHLQFLPTFAVNTDLNLSPSSAAMMSSVAALAFTIGRCLSIPLAIKLKPQTILYSNHLLMVIGCVLLAIYANSREDMLWLANAILGLGFSSVYASIYAFLEQQIRVTNRVGSIFVFAGGLTAAVSPSLVGQYIEVNPLILVWFNLACCLLCLCIFVAIHLVVSFSQKKRKQDIAKENTLLSKDINLMDVMAGDDGDDNNGSYDIEGSEVDNNDDTITREKKFIHKCLVESDRARMNSSLNLMNNNLFNQLEVEQQPEGEVEPNSSGDNSTSGESTADTNDISSENSNTDDDQENLNPPPYQPLNQHIENNVNEHGHFIVPA